MRLVIPEGDFSDLTPRASVKKIRSRSASDARRRKWQFRKFGMVCGQQTKIDFVQASPTNNRHAGVLLEDTLD
jgi:hypothetical protein